MAKGDRRMKGRRKATMRVVRRHRTRYPIIRRRRCFFRRRRRFNLERRVLKTYMRPILARFFFRHEAAIPGDQYHSHMLFNLNIFNKDSIRQQLYGYMEVFDEFKVIMMESKFHFKTSAEYTDLYRPFNDYF